MPKNELFGKNIDPACSYCQHSTPTQDPAVLNCPHKGKVEAGASCRRFFYDPLRRVPTPQLVLPKFDAEEFKL
jgi:hypothetical protein